jgi:glycosyltransferase involved in cell wall biosynthesis
MNICLIGPRDGGSATYFEGLGGSLKKRGHHVHIIAWGNGNEKSEHYSMSMVRVLPIPMFRGLGLIVFGIFLTLLSHCKERFDVFHAVYAFPSGFIAAICGKIVKVPVVISCIGGDLNILPKKILYRRLISWEAKLANKVICVSEPLERVAKLLGIDPKKTVVIPPGVSVKNFDLGISKEEARRKVRVPEKSKVILFVGRLIEAKRVDRIIRVLKRVLDLHPQAYLIVVGDGPKRAHLSKLSCDLGVKDHVRFEGLVSHELVPFYFSACDIFILPSDSEGLPTVILEAMASGKPVIASAVGGVPNLILDGVNGILFDPKDEDAMVVSINRVLSSNIELCQITKIAFKTARQYEWGRLVKRIERVYILSILERCNLPKGNRCVA